MNEKIYWVGQNLKHSGSDIRNALVIMDLLDENDDKICLQYERMFCFSKNADGVSAESKAEEMSLEQKRKEVQIRKKESGTREIKSLK